MANPRKLHNIGNWFLKPTKKQLMIQISIMLFGWLCLVFAATDGFNEMFFIKKNIPIIVLMLWSGVTMSMLIRNYLKNKRTSPDIIM
jgi:hypothetical protein